MAREFGDKLEPDTLDLTTLSLFPALHTGPDLASPPAEGAGTLSRADSWGSRVKHKKR